MLVLSHTVEKFKFLFIKSQKINWVFFEHKIRFATSVYYYRLLTTLLEIYYMANVSCPKAVDISPLLYQLLYIIPPSKCNQNDTKTAIYTKLLKTEIWNCLHALFQNCSRPNCSSTCRSLPWTKYRTGAWLWSKFAITLVSFFFIF